MQNKNNKNKNKNKTAKNKTQPKGESSRAMVMYAPVTSGTKLKGAAAPKIRNNPDGSCQISHMEYVTDITATSAISVIDYSVNPQRNALFTWLSAIATRFEMYRFTKLKFTYKPSCSTTTEGWVGLGFDFDAYDVAPGKAELLTWKYSKKSSPWQEMVLDVSQDSRISTFRYADGDERGDKRLDVLGNFYCLASSDATKFVGELFVDYTIVFRQPSYKVPPALYQTYLNTAWGSYNAWFDDAVKTGNMLIEKISNNSVLIKDVGSFLISAGVQASSGIVDNLDITFSEPAGSPSSDFFSQVLLNAVSGSSTISNRYLRVDVPPVLMTLAGITAGTSLSSMLRIATYRV